MYLHLSDTRLPLQSGAVIDTGGNGRIIVDKYIGSGGFALMYLAHREGSNRYLALKELFPRQLENVIIRRSEGGRICILDPVTGAESPDTLRLWQELTGHFDREARLTRRAGTVYDLRGNQASQNHPDVLHVDGPFRDSLGNFYLAVDTFQGESLQDLIERGFVRDEDGDVVTNKYLAEILELLTEVSIRLSALHEQGLWHLDLSPYNIYVVPSAGQTRQVPYLIDYGSAYDWKNPEEGLSHRYTCNPYSAPEVQALAQLQDASCGYAPSAASDTYGLAAILFYAVTGQVFSPAHRMHRTDWTEKLRREFTGGLPAHLGADAFVDALSEFLDRGLRVSQRSRYTTATAMYNALKQLSARYREYGNMLPRENDDELMSYMVLEKYPLYQYRGSDGNIHVLCLGSGIFVRRMILSLISCGQMIGSRLYIHVVSNQPQSLLTGQLLAAAPMLEVYSNLTGSAEHEYVTFSYTQVNDVLDPATCRRILKSHGDTHYFLISLGSNSANLEAVGLYARALAERPDPGGQQTILNYYCSEDAANSNHGFPLPEDLPDWLKIDAFGSNLSSYSKVIRTLGLRTIRLAHMYDKQFNPNISLAETAQALASDSYNQRSSCAAALHLKYKLASAGITPDLRDNRPAILSGWQKYLCGGGIGALLELEHRRWMMYMISDGYRLPTQKELELYGFEMVGGKFNGSFKCREQKLHPCLVPCGSGGIVLQHGDFLKYTTREKIDSAPFDGLDRVSLSLHALAGQKCRSILRGKTIESCFSAISDRLNERTGIQDPALPREAARELLEKAQERICTAAKNLTCKTDHGLLTGLEHAFRQCGINISKELTGLKQCLAVFAEYAAFKDYKVFDLALIRNLLWILYGGNEGTVIKLRGRTIADNITGPMILDPHRLIFFGEEPHREWDAFLYRHGNRGQIRYFPRCGDSRADMAAALKQLIGQQEKCVIDITGAEERMVIAALDAANDNPGVSLIRSTPAGTLENVHRFITAPAYTLKTAISAEEIFSLYGAAEKPPASRYMEHLESKTPALWQFYREFRRDWDMITAFFADHAAGSPELQLRDIRIEPDTGWLPYTRWISWAQWNMPELQAVFENLSGAGLIREFSAESDSFSGMFLSFQYPCDDSIRSALDEFFTKRLPFIFVPLHCSVKFTPGSGYCADISSGCWVSIRDQERSTCSAVLPALRRLESLRLIANLDADVPPDGGPVRISFSYVIPAVKDCLSTADSILELYIWSEARRTHYFDHAQANFSFTWKEGISNELDVILTKGLTSLIICAKPAGFSREHLYEIKYLTERFSLNSRSVIVYASGQAREDGQELLSVKERARAMGIRLIDLDDPDAGNLSLGDRLIRIAADTATL